MTKKYTTPSMVQLFEAGVHFGHQVRRWHPSMEPYIFTSKNNIHIIDLEQTENKLKEASDFLYETAKTGGQIIFVGTKKQSREVIELEAKRCGACFVTERWLGGIITNFDVVKKNMDKLVKMSQGKEDGSFDKYTKKERLLISREIDKLQKKVGGLLTLRGTPSAIFVIDPKREKTVVHESKKSGVPVVALIDTNSDVRGIDYPIPGNDDAIRSVAFITKAVADAIEAGYQDYADVEKAKMEKAEKGEETKKAVEPKVKIEVKIKAEAKTEEKKIEKAAKRTKETKEVKAKTSAKSKSKKVSKPKAKKEK